MIHLAICRYRQHGSGSVTQETFSKIPGCRIVAGCDVDGPRAAAFCSKHSIPRSYADLDLMLKEGGIDAVVNVTPDRFHAPVSIKAIPGRQACALRKAARPELCRRPMTMVKAAKSKGVINMVNFSYRNAPAIHKAHQLISSGKLGDIVHVDASYLQSWLATIGWGNWRTSPRLTWRLSTRHGSAGALGDIGIHLVDFVSYAVGGVKTVSAQLKSFTKIKGKKRGEYTLDANDSAMMQVEFENGALGTLHTTRWGTGHLNTIELLVCGTKGALRINLDKGYDRLEISTGKDLPSREMEGDPRVRGRPSIARCAVHQVDPDWLLMISPISKRGAEVQKVLDACFVSDATGKRVRCVS